jgi:hypothetical protein
MNGQNKAIQIHVATLGWQWKRLKKFYLAGFSWILKAD